MEVTPPNAYDFIVVVEQMPNCFAGVTVSAVLPGRISDYVQPLS